MRVREFMTTNLITVSSHTSIIDARKFMIAHGIRRLPVVDRGKLVGMVSDREGGGSIALCCNYPERLGNQLPVE